MGESASLKVMTVINWFTDNLCSLLAYLTVAHTHPVHGDLSKILVRSHIGNGIDVYIIMFSHIHIHSQTHWHTRKYNIYCSIIIIIICTQKHLHDIVHIHSSS